MSLAIVTGSFPHGVTSPMRTSTVPFPPSCPPCHTYITAAGENSSIQFMSIAFPTLRRTTVLSHDFDTVSMRSRSVCVRR